VGKPTGSWVFQEKADGLFITAIRISTPEKLLLGLTCGNATDPFLLMGYPSYKEQSTEVFNGVRETE